MCSDAMDKSPLVTEQIDAGEWLIREFSKQIPVQAAFWLRERDSDEWYFYLASDQIDDSNFDHAYAEVLRSFVLRAACGSIRFR